MWICLSKSLDRVDRIEIGLKLPRSWIRSFLWIGTTFVVFHSSGNIQIGRNTSTSYRYIACRVNMIVQVYIYLIYCGNRHNVCMKVIIIFTGKFHKWYVYVRQKYIHIICICLSWTDFNKPQSMCLYWQKFIHIKRTGDCRQVDKIEMDIIVQNDTGIGPIVMILTEDPDITSPTEDLEITSPTEDPDITSPTTN